MTSDEPEGAPKQPDAGIHGAVGATASDTSRRANPEAGTQGSADKPSTGEPHKPRSVRWRPILLLVVLLIAIATGFYYKSKAEPGTEPISFENSSPQYLNIWVTNPQLAVNVTVYIMPDNLGGDPAAGQSAMGAEEEVKVTASPASAASAAMVAITSSVPSLIPKPTHTSVSPDHSIPLSPGLYLDHYFPMSTFGAYAVGASASLGNLSTTLNNGQQIIFDASYYLSQIILESNGSTFGHLPALGVDDGLSQSYDYCSPMLGESRNIFSSLNYFIENPVPRLPLKNEDSLCKLSSYYAPHDGTAMLFWRPANLSYTVVLEDAVPSLSNDQIDYMTPTAQIQGDNYVWQANSTLEPVFKETDPGATNEQTDAAFTSGIALGIAAAAAIALIQELPERVKLPMFHGLIRLRRKAS